MIQKTVLPAPAKYSTGIMTTPTTKYTSVALVSLPGERERGRGGREREKYKRRWVGVRESQSDGHECSFLFSSPNSLIFSPLFLMDMNHHTTIQNASAKSRVGLVTLRKGGRKRRKRENIERKGAGKVTEDVVEGTI